MSSKQSLGLGKGIGALIPKDLISQGRSSQQSLTATDESAEVGVALVDIDRIISANPVQPRRDFNEKALQELAQSIAVHGVITPITVRKHFDDYELISGERRLRASKMAGLDTIPAYVIAVSSNAEMLEIALVENVQRENLNPLETAQGYARLIEECGLTQEEVAAKVAKDRSTVANMLRLLKLPADIQAAVRQQNISMGHARAMLALSTEQAQLGVLREVITKDLSVRKTEALVKDIELGRVSVGRGGAVQKPANNKQSSAGKDIGVLSSTVENIESSLRHVLGTQVRLKMKNTESGVIDIEFYSLEELERLLDLLTSIGGEGPTH